MSALIETRALTRRFGALSVAEAIDFRLEQGARHALIGPNGAGKTSFVNLLTGALAPHAGQVLMSGVDVTGLGVAQRAARGLGRTFQITSLFGSLPVLDNVAIAIAEREGLAFRIGSPASGMGGVRDEAFAILEGLGLSADALLPLAELPYGKQRLVDIAVALALKPGVLLLDEPAAGVPAADAGRIFEALEALPRHIAVLIIEHDMELVFRFARRITVLVQGRVLMEGSPAEVAAHRQVREIYLGEAHG